jgi:hypothetical protein
MDMNQLTKITLSWELYEQRVPKTIIAQRLEVNRETVRIWIRGILSNPLGLTGFIDSYLNAKKGERRKRKIDGLLKAYIYRIRKRKQRLLRTEDKKILKRRA